MRRGHGQGYVAKPGDYVAAPASAPTNSTLLGESVSGVLATATETNAYATWSTRSLWPWVAAFPVTFWVLGKIGGVSREGYEGSQNPSFSEATEVAFKVEDKVRFDAQRKLADDEAFAVYAGEKVAEFAALGAGEKSGKQDAYASDLVAYRVAQAKESRLVWLSMQQREFDLKKARLATGPFH